MRVVRHAADALAWSARYRCAGLSVGFVPTLGALHDGHAALIEEARKECERVFVSIYLNPTQFDSSGDLSSYPRTPDRDLQLCRDLGVDVVLLGSTAEMLPQGFQTHVEVEELTRSLCGASRPGHFRGVATVVLQLLHIAAPHRAYFGLKDYQQAMVIRRLVNDLIVDCEIRLVPTVRAPDGLALSSRNARLSPEERQAARSIHRALRAAESLIRGGESTVRSVVEGLESTLEEAGLRVDYIEVVEAATLRPLADQRVGARGEARNVLIAVAAYAGATRLIDNLVV